MADRKYGYITLNAKAQTCNSLHVLAELMLDKGAEGLTVDKVLNHAIRHAIDEIKSTELKQINVV